MSNENLISESKEVAKYIPESAAARVYRLIEALNEAERKLESVVAENAAQDNFVSEMLSIAWQGGSADGSDIQELALKHGLIRQEVYSADEHETLVDDPGNFEDGDPVYFRIETPATSAFLAEVRASGVEMFAEHLSGMNISASETSVREFAAQLRQEAK